MSIKDKVQRFVEDRKLEAIRDEIGNKMIAIVRNLGSPITSVQKPIENGFLWDDGKWEEGGLPTIKNWTESDYGWYFDGLKFGVNITITCFAEEEKIFEVKCTYNGYCVFEEIEGVVKSYAPFPEWINRFEEFYSLAKKREEIKKEKTKIEKTEDNKKKLSQILSKIKLLWNYGSNS